ncbi:MAG TPA: hypothetical protein VLZ05_14730, partial [Mycobacterium sp.]
TPVKRNPSPQVTALVVNNAGTLVQIGAEVVAGSNLVSPTIVSPTMSPLPAEMAPGEFFGGRFHARWPRIRTH